MRIILRHQSITKILTQATTLEALRLFTIQNLNCMNNEKYKNLYYQYTDLDGDKIMVASQQDFRMMLQTVKALYVKMELVEQTDHPGHRLQTGNLDDINRSRLISQNSVKHKQCFLKQQRKAEDIKQGIDSQQNFFDSQIADRNCRISQEDIIKFKQSQHTPTQLQNTNKITYFEKFKEKEQNVIQNAKQKEGLINTLSLSHRQLEIKLDKKINQLVNQKVKRIIPCIQRHVKKQIQVKMMQQSRKSLKESKIKFNKKIECKHRIQTKVKNKIKQQSVKLSSQFGGKPFQYQSFAQEHFGLKTEKLIQIYNAKNIKGCINNQSLEVSKIQKRIRKLGTYYSCDSQHFRQFVQTNPKLKFPQLIQMIQQSRIKQEKSLQSSKEIQCKDNFACLRKPKINQENFLEYQIYKQCPFETRKQRIKTHKIEKNQSKQLKCAIEHKTQKSEIVFSSNKLQLRCQNAQIKKSQKKKRTNLSKNLKQELTRKAQFLILFKALFGVQNIKEYLQFYNQNSELNQRQLFERWIDQNL